MDKQMCRLWRGIDPAAKAAFFSCFLVGYLAHLFAFANLIPNADGLSRVYDPQQMTVSGRWFLHYASALNDFTQMPAAILSFSGSIRETSMPPTVMLPFW